MPASEEQLPEAREIEDASSSTGYTLRFPQSADELHQDEEWCEALIDGRWERIRFHDYDIVYSHEGLYDALFGEDGAMRCASPRRIVSFLHSAMREAEDDPTALRVLDLGAGNGMIGRRLRDIGAERVVGADIIPEAKMAAHRDRPGVYDDYVVADFTALSPDELRRLGGHGFNALTAVSALGFGDIPPRAFATAYNLVADRGWIAINVKEGFLRGGGDSGFSRMIWSMMTGGALHVHAFQRYCHRVSVRGQKLHYVAIIGRKLHDAPEDLVAEHERA